uniref:Immunoglobulin V-set domain-containing protein n=1 Tax=Seriola lalandi dorsalis TaxID=1841481 RepID=A0A3B4X6T2_SERLL
MCGFLENNKFLRLGTPAIVTLFLLQTEPGTTDGNDVNQTPILWKDKGYNATIHCNHTKDASYSQMYWYRQLPGETMELIVFTTTSKNDFGDFDKKKFSATRPGIESGTFTVENLDFFIFLLWIKGKLTFYFRDGSRGL